MNVAEKSGKSQSGNYIWLHWLHVFYICMIVMHGDSLFAAERLTESPPDSGFYIV